MCRVGGSISRFARAPLLQRPAAANGGREQLFPMAQGVSPAPVPQARPAACATAVADGA
jgi:hypothetical protein